MPEEIYSSIKSSLHDRVKNPRYARVFMPLSSLLEGDFFNKYIKIGIYFTVPCKYILNRRDKINTQETKHLLVLILSFLK